MEVRKTIQSKAPDFSDGGFYRSHNALVDYFARRIGPAGVAVYDAINRHAFPSPVAKITVRQLVILTGVKRTTVFKVLKVLEEHYMLDRAGGVGDTNTYLMRDLNQAKQLMARYGSRVGNNGQLLDDIFLLPLEIPQRKVGQEEVSLIEPIPVSQSALDRKPLPRRLPWEGL